MKVLIDITHPAFALMFRELIYRLRDKGHEVLVTSRDKDVTLELLDAFGVEHRCLTRMARSPLGLFGEMLVRDWRLWRVVREVRPDVLLAADGVYAAHVGWLTGTPAVSFDVADDAWIQQRLYFPFATRIYTQPSYRVSIGHRQRFYRGVFSLAYLHPKYFTPDASIRSRLDLPQPERIIVCRLVSWTSNHDLGHRGFDRSGLSDLVAALSEYGQVLITSESRLPHDLESYRIKVRTEEFHHLLAQASLYVGESPTVAIESAVLGVPAVFVSTRTVSYIEEIKEKYGLVRTARDGGECLSAAKEILTNADYQPQFRQRLSRYLEDVDDLVDVMEAAVIEASRSS